MNDYFKKGVYVMIKRNSDGSTYVTILPWVRLIFREGRYDGWYNPRLNKIL